MNFSSAKIMKLPLNANSIPEKIHGMSRRYFALPRFTW